jgi:hypothetical protein
VLSLIVNLRKLQLYLRHAGAGAAGLKQAAVVCAKAQQQCPMAVIREAMATHVRVGFAIAHAKSAELQMSGCRDVVTSKAQADDAPTKGPRLGRTVDCLRLACQPSLALLRQDRVTDVISHDQPHGC